MVMIFPVRKEKGSGVENKEHRGSLHKTPFSPGSPFRSEVAPLSSHVIFGFELC